MSYDEWIGRSVTEHGFVSSYPADCFTVTLDRDDPRYEDGDPLPPAWHYFYFHEVVPLAETAADGHRIRGRFTPQIPLRQRLWAGSRMRFESPIRVGEPVRKVVTIAGVSEKQGKNGPLCFVTTTEEVLGGDGRIATVEERTQVYRNPPKTPPAARPAPENPAWSRTVRPCSVLLFRYSALTMNSHRIHYDRDYVRDVEGYPGLVVHGPLLMTLMLDLFRRERPEARMTSLDVRAVSPVYDVADFSVHGSPNDADDACRLWTATASGALAMTADVAYEN